MADQETAPEAENSNLQQEDENVAKSTPPNARTCGVCMTMPAKYKCTRCELPYCSISCNVEHKATHPALPDPPAPQTNMDTPSPANASTPAPRAGTQAAAGRPHVLAPLATSPDLSKLFTLYPSLREQLLEIYHASQPPTDDIYAPNDPRGRYNNAGRDNMFWTKEQGTRDGVEALQAAKKKFGKDGEGVREFASLVVGLVSPENAINGALDGPTVIQRQAQEENARMITQLLNGELGNF